MTLGTLVFTPQQEAAIDAIRRWYTDPAAPQVFRMFGCAGVGKTSVARAIPAQIGSTRPRFAAFAGKAASVLRRKGCSPASTLHALIYKPKTNTHGSQAKALREAAALTMDETHAARLLTEAAEHEKLAHVPLFELSEGSDMTTADLLICDEVSMVGRDLAEDILSFGVKVLVLGDPEQLPPIEGAGYFTSAAPDILLDEVHRQALDSPVLALATRVRTSVNHSAGLTAADFASRPLDLRRSRHLVNLVDLYDQVICGKRATRWQLVNAMREALHRPAGVPVPGDRVMCVANNRSLEIFNGQQFEVIEATPGRREHILTVLSDEGHVFDVAADPAGFRDDDGEKQVRRTRFRGEVGGFTFAQAITAHKAQGSEWDRVLVVDESAVFAWHTTREDGPEAGRAMKRRWLYTATTRAAQSVTLITMA